MPVSNRHFHLACWMTFFSGAAALTYELIWTRMFSLAFGSTTWAVSTVFGVFLFGMGIGAALYQKVLPRIQNPFRLYAILEFGIAASALGSTILLRQMPGIYAGLSDPGDGNLQTTLIRLALTITALGVPSFLMGATLPALCVAVLRSQQEVSHDLGTLYGLNTVGAAVGALITGFVAVEFLGYMNSVIAGCVVNVSVGITAWRTPTSALSKQPVVRTIDGKPEAQRETPQNWIPYLVLAVSGFVTLAYEVVWFRAAKYLIGNSTYSLSILLSLFLAGLGIGSLIHRRIGPRGVSVSTLAVVQALIALAAILSIGALAIILRTPSLADRLSIFEQSVALLPWAWRLGVAFGISTILLLPAAICMGLSFPMACQLALRKGETSGRGVGRAYLIANIGCVLGALSTAAWLLPLFGTLGVAKFLSVLNLTLALIALIVVYGSTTKVTRTMSVAFVAATLLLLIFLPSKMEFHGEFDRTQGAKILYQKEGDLSTVKVVASAASSRRAMTLDGYAIGIDREFGDAIVQKQLLLAHLPMSLSPDSKRTLNIGLGSGTTLASMASYRSIQSLDCVEISGEVVEGARHFEDGAVMDDPRVRVIVDDALHFLLRDTARYDIIVSDAKQNPQFSGNAALLSIEFYEASLSRLDEYGIFVQWLPGAYPGSAFGIAVRTFTSAFPWAAAYYFPPESFILVGGKQPLPSTQPQGGAFFASRGPDDLEHFLISTDCQLLSGYLAGGDRLREYFAAWPVNGWDRPILEFVPNREFDHRMAIIYGHQNLRDLFQVSSADTTGYAPMLDSECRSYRESTKWIQLGYLELFRTMDAESIRPFLMRASRANPEDQTPVQLLERVAEGPAGLMSWRRPGPK